MNIETREIRCLHCDVQVATRRSAQKYCSPSCGNKHRTGVFRSTNPEANSMYFICRRGLDPAWVMMRSAKYAARKKGLEFSLEPGDLSIPERCPIFDIPLYFTKNVRTYNTPSLDRIDNTKGYIKGNVHIISWRANILKSDSTLEELEQLVTYLKEVTKWQ